MIGDHPAEWGGRLGVMTKKKKGKGVVEGKEKRQR
jgi:hypothetical protein